jgi:beta-galactosidase
MKNGDPFLLMESTPSMQNWAPVCKQKRPGMHQLSSLLAVAHGSDGVLYFQYRKSRGSAEKFHGAVVDHVGHEHNRVFREVADLGEKLERLGVVAGSRSPAEVAILFDWENRWAIEGAAGPCNAHKDYVQTCVAHYRPFWKRGITVDVIDSTCDFSGYKLLIAPMLYMIRPGVAERMTAFVEAGGTFVTTYLSGVADENDLCFLTGFPGPLRPLLGIWSEEMDALYDEDVQTVIPLDDNDLGLDHVYDASHICEIIHAESARVLADYGADYYAGEPAVTVNDFGQGQAYYVASRNDDRFIDDLAAGLIRRIGIQPNLEGDLPEGVTVQRRTNGKEDFLFVLNFVNEERTVSLGSTTFHNLLTDKTVTDELTLHAYGSTVLRRDSSKVSEAA